MRPSFTGLFSVCESAKAIVFLKFPLKSGPSYAIVREKTNFTDGHVHVLSIFVKKKKLFSCTVLTRENCKTARERGKNAKQSFASRVLSLLLCAIDEVGKIKRLPRWVWVAGKLQVFCFVQEVKRLTSLQLFSLIVSTFLTKEQLKS